MMATNDKELSAASMDNRPPMLEEINFNSWKIRIERYIHEIPTHQRNTKFLNNLLSYWGKYVTIVKNSKDISTASYVSLYTYLKSYEQHAMKTLSKMNQTCGNADPLAYMAHATKSTSSPSQYVPPSPQYAHAPQQTPQ
nr:hypothetical protein [Tanacetum cinerariifolium]